MNRVSQCEHSQKEYPFLLSVRLEGGLPQAGQAGFVFSSAAGVVAMFVFLSVWDWTSSLPGKMETPVKRRTAPTIGPDVIVRVSFLPGAQPLVERALLLDHGLPVVLPRPFLAVGREPRAQSMIRKQRTGLFGDRV